MKIRNDFKLIESRGKYFYNGDEYKVDMQGNGLKVFTNKKSKYSIITDDSLKTITVLYPRGDGNFAYMTMGVKIDEVREILDKFYNDAQGADYFAIEYAKNARAEEIVKLFSCY